MTAKEYLSALKIAETKIQQKREKRLELLEKSTSIAVPLNPAKVQTSARHDKMEYYVVKAADLEKEIEEALFDFVLQKHKIINEIQELSGVNHLDLLFKKYVQYDGLKQISKKMGLSYQYVRHLHKSALQKFEKVHAEMSENTVILGGVF